MKKSIKEKVNEFSIKTDETYTIDASFYELTKDQYESIWAKLVDINMKTGVEIIIKGKKKEKLGIINNKA